MTPERWRQITTIFHAAIARDEQARAAWLDEACAGDQDLRVEVDSMVRAHQAAQHFGELALPTTTGISSLIGQTLQHYRIRAALGRGGMGIDYAADDTMLHRRVALKILPADVAADPDRLQRFRREVQAVAAISHPNVVTIYSVEEADGVHFLTMELVEGKTLVDLLRARGMRLDALLRIALPLVDAVSAAHERGIVHRDLKPANVMVGDNGRVKVLD